MRLESDRDLLLPLEPAGGQRITDIHELGPVPFPHGVLGDKELAVHQQVKGSLAGFLSPVAYQQELGGGRIDLQVVAEPTRRPRLAEVRVAEHAAAGAAGQQVVIGSGL